MNLTSQFSQFVCKILQLKIASIQDEKIVRLIQIYRWFMPSQLRVIIEMTTPHRRTVSFVAQRSLASKHISIYLRVCLTLNYFCIYSRIIIHGKVRYCDALSICTSSNHPFSRSALLCCRVFRNFLILPLFQLLFATMINRSHLFDFSIFLLFVSHSFCLSLMCNMKNKVSKNNEH